MRFTIPNMLTLLRLLLIPVFIGVFYLPYTWAPMVAAAVFGIAALTDWLDGYIARKFNQMSPFGAFLDPVADKVMIAATLILLTDHYASIWLTIPAITIVSREIIISALREWMAEIGKRGNVAVSSIGKWKTTAQMIALPMLLWHFNEWMIWGGYLALYIATALTYWSMYKYLHAAKDDLLENS